MAVTIIKGGKNEFVGHCKWCGCDFRYTADDVLKANDQVACPQVGCGRLLQHFGENGTSSVDVSMRWWAGYGQQNAAAAAFVNRQASMLKG